MCSAPRSARDRCPSFAVLAVVLVLGACGPSGSSTPASPAPTSSVPSPAVAPSSAGPATAPDPGAAFCLEVQANGATGASFGPVVLSYRKQQLLDDVRDKLDAMGQVRPPAEIAEAWALQKRTLLRIEAAAARLSDGQALGDASAPTDVRDLHGGTIDRAQETLTDYYFAHCH